MEGFYKVFHSRYSLDLFHLSALLSAGLMAAVCLPALPSSRLLALLACVALLLVISRYRTANIAGWILVGAVWAIYVCQQQYGRWIPESMEGRDVQLTGRLLDLPRATDNGWQFDFAAENPPGKIRLAVRNDNGQSWTPATGCRYRLTARLKRPRGLLNLYQYDYQAWLLQAGYIATGYVRTMPLCEESGTDTLITLRSQLATWIGQVPLSRKASSTLQGLLIGSYADIDVQQWQILRDSGTIHLLSVSGLHIVMVATLVHTVTSALVRLLVYPLRVMPASSWGGCAALLAATAYALLAGFSVATQRSLIMVAVALLQRFLYGRFVPGAALLLSLAVVLLLNPLTVLSAGFWFSFVATGVLVASGRGRLPLHPVSALSVIRETLRLQWLLFVLMAPLLLYVYGRVPLLSLPMNLVAVPWVSFVSMPLGLAAICAYPVSTTLAGLLLRAAGWTLDIYWQCMAAGVDYAQGWQWVSGHVGWPALLLAMAGMAALYLLPAGLPMARYGVLLCLPLWLLRDDFPAHGEVDVMFMDVGQGLSVLVRTARHAMVYDTGDRSSSRFDSGRDIVAPALRNWRIGSLDLLMLSHADSDHAGGAPGLLEEFPAWQRWSGTPGMLPAAVDALPCRRGMHWRWDDVDFRVLSPAGAVLPQHGQESGNNRSCVLLVSAGEHKVLLTGDIEEKAERQLVQREQNLHADVLSAPHHGSKTSSSTALLAAVQPHDVVVSAGYLNRFHHPAGSVMQRYQAGGMVVTNTAEAGAVRFRLGSNGISRKTVLCERHVFWRDARFSQYCDDLDSGN